MILDSKIRKIIRKRRSTQIKGNVDVPRVVFSESNCYIRVQAIDDKNGHTLAYSSTQEIKENQNYSCKNIIYAKKLAEIFADKLIKINKKTIKFDRNGKLYHGKVLAFCETMRQKGINF